MMRSLAPFFTVTAGRFWGSNQAFSSLRVPPDLTPGSSQSTSLSLRCPKSCEDTVLPLTCRWHSCAGQGVANVVTWWLGSGFHVLVNQISVLWKVDLIMFRLQMCVFYGSKKNAKNRHPEPNTCSAPSGSEPARSRHPLRQSLLWGELDVCTSQQ